MTSIPFNLFFSYQSDKNQADFAHIGNPSPRCPGLPSCNWSSWQKRLFSGYRHSPASAPVGLSCLLPSSSFPLLPVLGFSYPFLPIFHPLLLFLMPRSKFSTRPPFLASAPSLPHPLFCPPPLPTCSSGAALLSPAGVAFRPPSCPCPSPPPRCPLPAQRLTSCSEKQVQPWKRVELNTQYRVCLGQRGGFSRDSQNTSLGINGRHKIAYFHLFF